MELGIGVDGTGAPLSVAEVVAGGFDGDGGDWACAIIEKQKKAAAKTRCFIVVQGLPRSQNR
ncbi:MAG TPA: hypothetical protein VK208_06960, partial [Pyrinomonadaceae bacterium]|nr:hypothetical protein [Pyrinomonadaceae bacterium]